MSGVAASVLLRSRLTVADSSRVMDVLRAFDPDVSDSRKGRYWELASGCVVITVSVLDTEQHNFDSEVQQQGLTFSEAPEMVVVACGVRDSGAGLCSQIAEAIATGLGGISLGLVD